MSSIIISRSGRILRIFGRIIARFSETLQGFRNKLSLTYISASVSCRTRGEIPLLSCYTRDPFDELIIISRMTSPACRHCTKFVWKSQLRTQTDQVVVRNKWSAISIVAFLMPSNKTPGVIKIKFSFYGVHSSEFGRPVTFLSSLSSVASSLRL